MSLEGDPFEKAVIEESQKIDGRIIRLKTCMAQDKVNIKKLEARKKQIASFLGKKTTSRQQGPRIPSTLVEKLNNDVLTILKEVGTALAPAAVLDAILKKREIDEEDPAWRDEFEGYYGATNSPPSKRIQNVLTIAVRIPEPPIVRVGRGFYKYKE